MKKNGTLTPAQRLIIAADFTPVLPERFTLSSVDGSPILFGRDDVRSKILTLADSLQGTGVCLKVNSALRACGYGLIDEIHRRGLRVFADLKFFDIGETLGTDGQLLKEAKPEIVTTVCAAGISAMRALKAQLPDTEVLGVTVLTSIEQDEANRIFHHAALIDNVCMFARHAAEAGIDGIICAPTEAEAVRRNIPSHMTVNTPNIRPSWMFVEGDDQSKKRSMTPAEAIKAGVDRIVVGRPIVRAEKPYDAAMRTIDEITSALN